MKLLLHYSLPFLVCLIFFSFLFTPKSFASFGSISHQTFDPSTGNMYFNYVPTTNGSVSGISGTCDEVQIADAGRHTIYWDGTNVSCGSGTIEANSLVAGVSDSGVTTVTVFVHDTTYGWDPTPSESWRFPVPPTPTPTPTNTPTPTPTIVLAINTGGTTQGNFVADTDYSGGTQYSSTHSVDTGSETNPAPEAVYKSVRYGNETYTIPNLTANTNYTVRLHFNELYWGTDGNDGTGKRIFNVSINGSQVLGNFDIYKTAGGSNKGVVEQFNATSDSSGDIAIALSTVTDNAMVNGIEIDTLSIPTYSLTGTVYNDTNRNGSQDSGESGYSGATVKLNTGQTTTTDSNGNYTFSNLPQEDSYTAEVTLPNAYVATTTNPVRFSLNANTTENFGIAPFQSLAINAGGTTSGSFLADLDYSGGQTYSTSNSIDTSGVTNPAPQAVYQSVRYGNISYTIPNLDVSHTYNVRLHFNELYWNSAGSRVFNVGINGAQVLSNYDIFQDAGGSNIAVVKQFTATPDTNGNITITFTSVTDNAMVSGIEVSN